MAIMSNRLAVPTAGKRQQLWTTPQVVDSIDIFALDSNTERVHVGDVGVQAPLGLETGWPLSAREAVTFKQIDISTIYVDARVAGEGVSWGAEFGN